MKGNIDVYKVCFVISGLAYSGAEIVLERYLDMNEEIDPYFIIIYRNKKIIKLLIDKYGAHRVFTINLRHSKNRLRFLPMYDAYILKKHMRKYISLISPQVIYANNTIESMLIGKYINKSNIKSLAHIHDMKKSIKSCIRKMYTEKMLTRYDEIITVSNACKEDWGIQRMKVIYNGINSTYIKEEVDIRLKIKNIGFIGSISRRKGVDIIIENIEKIISNNFILHIAYSNIDDRRLFNKLNEKSKLYPQNIILYENLASDKVKKFYDMIDILIVPSRQDPLPTVIMEAMARNTLVIGNNVDGIPEILNNKELLFNIEEKNCITSKIDELENKSKQKIEDIIICSNKRCKKNFSYSGKKEKVNNIIKEILGG